MQLSQHIGLALLLALTPLGAVQDDKKSGETKPTKLTEPQSEAERIRQDLLGAWRLERANTSGEEFSGPACRGVMLVLDGYLSMTAQLDSVTLTVRSTTGELFSSGAYRWIYDEERLVVRTTTMVAIDNFNPTDSVQYEPPGVNRDYRVDLVGDVLTLARENGGRLEFSRMLPARAEEPTKKKR